MSYIGTEPKDIRSFGRTKFDYTATQGQTAFTGADDDGKVLAFTVGQIEVYVNGILMDDSDFTTTGTGTVTLATAANLNDVVNVVSFETNIPDSNYVPASGGTFTGNVTNSGNVTVGGTLGVTGDLTVDTNTLHVDVADNRVGIGTNTPAKVLDITESAAADTGQVKLTYAGGDGNRAGFILNNTHTGGREYGIYVGNNSTGGGLGSSLGISDNTASTAYRLLIDSSGRVTMPSQPQFVLQGSFNNFTTITQAGAWLPFTGATGNAQSSGGVIAMNWTSSRSGGYNPTGNGFNATTGVYTAPVTGTYMFTFNAYLNKPSHSGGEYVHINSYINGANQDDYTIYGYMAGSGSYQSPEITKVIRMATNDTFGFRIYLNVASSFKIYPHYTCIAGYLLG
jgi:hypothetical protein